MMTYSKTRRYPRITSPLGVRVAWQAKGPRTVSRVAKLGLGGLFVSNPEPPAADEVVNLLLDLPGVELRAMGVVRDSRPGVGMGLEFTTMGQEGRARLQQLVTRLLLESRIEHPRRFRFERVSRIIAGTTPLPLRSGLHTVLHVIPLTAPAVDDQFEATISRLHQGGQLLPVFSSWAHNSRCDSDDYLIHNGLNNSDPVGSYLQVFRSGALESLNTLAPLDPSLHQKQIQPLDLEIRLLKVLPQYFTALKSLGTQPPVILGLSLIGVAAYSMAIPPTAASSFACRVRRFDSDTLFLPEVVAETFECNLGEVLKPVFDALWKAAGWEESIFYENSEWVGLARVFPKGS